MQFYMYEFTEHLKPFAAGDFTHIFTVSGFVK